ncbi:MAG TPA: glycoside hydrolase family 127 protein, partial [Halanaerobiales bacterium]|nr:glycoside hydrolase family 127 protein [Halanaerobiales bacterium]
LIASIGQYIYLYNDNEIYVNLYTGSNAGFVINGKNIVISQETDYPWEGKVKFDLKCNQPHHFTIALRIPAWCREPGLTVNGEDIDIKQVNQEGYALIDREWKTGDSLELQLPMKVEKLISNPKVRENAGKIALQRGPVVYCLEEEDNGPNLHNLFLDPATELKAEFDQGLFNGIAVVKGEAFRIIGDDWEDELYKPLSLKKKKVRIKAIPYYAWNNRSIGEMLVWIKKL